LLSAVIQGRHVTELGEIELGVLHGDRAINLHSAGAAAQIRGPAVRDSGRIVVSGRVYQRAATRLQRMQGVLNIPQRWAIHLLLGSAPPVAALKTPYRDGRYCAMLASCSSLTSPRVMGGMLGKRSS
jgi:hypothetical protein